MKLAVYGNTRSGKSVAVAKIVELLNNLSDKDNNVLELDYSQALREVVGVLYPDTLKTKDREKLIAVGQHMRELDEDIWVNVVKNKIDNNVDHEHIVVTGIRQENEYKALAERGFIFIKIEASEETRIKRCIEAGDNFEPSSLNHSTEKALHGFYYDFMIVNDEITEEEFLKRVATLILDLHLKESVFKDRMKKAERKGWDYYC